MEPNTDMYVAYTDKIKRNFKHLFVPKSDQNVYEAYKQ